MKSGYGTKHRHLKLVLAISLSSSGLIIEGLGLAHPALFPNARRDFPTTELEPVVYSYRSATGDFNGDGFPDVAVSSSQTGKVAIFLGDGLGGMRRISEFSADP